MVLMSHAYPPDLCFQTGVGFQMPDPSYSFPSTEKHVYQSRMGDTVFNPSRTDKNAFLQIFRQQQVWPWCCSSWAK